jgi:hypothetical protein
MLISYFQPKHILNHRYLLQLPILNEERLHNFWTTIGNSGHSGFEHRPTECIVAHWTKSLRFILVMLFDKWKEKSLKVIEMDFFYPFNDLIYFFLKICI